MTRMMPFITYGTYRGSSVADLVVTSKTFTATVGGTGFEARGMRTMMSR